MRLKASGRRKLKRKQAVANIKRDSQTTKRKKIVNQQTNEKRVEKALEESEAMYYALFENTGTGMLAIDEDTTILTMNTEFERISGYSKKEIEGKRSWTEFVAKGYLEKMREYHDLRRIDPKAAPRTYESKLIDRQGKIVDALLTVTLIPRTKKSIVSLVDITEHKKAEKELENLAKYPAENPSPILRLDKNGVILHANKACDPLLKDWGKKIGDYAPKYWSDLVAEVFESKSSRNVESESGTITYLFNLVPSLNSGHVNLYGRDITLRKKMEKEILAERGRLLTILDGVPFMVCLLKPDYHVDFANRAFKERFGESHGRRCYEYCFGKKEPCDFCEAYKALETGKPHHYEVIGPDGHTIIDVHDFPFSDTDGSPMILEVDVDVTERKRAEEALRISETRFRLTFDNMPSAVAVYEAMDDGNDFIFKDFNRAGEMIDQVKREDLVGQSVLKMFPGVKEFGLFDVFQKVWKTGEPTHHPTTLYKDQRITGWRENHVYKLPSGEIVAIYEDVTERKKLEEELNKHVEHLEVLVRERSAELVESESKFRAIFDNALDGIQLTDVETKRFLDGNNAFCRMLGYSLEELKNKTVMDIHPKESLPHVLEQFECLAKQKITLAENIPVKRKDGSIFYADISAAPMTFAGRLTVVGAFRDITERKAMEEALHLSEGRYRAVIEDQTELICRLRPDWTLTFVNNAYCNYFGKTRDELVGHTFEPLIVEEDREKIKNAQATLSPENPVVFYEERVMAPNGEIRWQEWSSRGIFDEKGRLVDIQGVGRDVTERRRLEEKLQKAQRLAGIGETATMIGHDLRNPLQVVMNRLYMARDAVNRLSGKYSEVARELGLEEMFTELEDQMRYMNKIVSDLQDYARQIEPQPVETDLNDLLDKTLSIIDIPSNVKIVREVDKDAAKIMIDPHLTQRVLHNLIINGIQAMPQGGTLAVKASKTMDILQISIQDTGVGIPPENLDRLWIALQTTKAKGVGLGLPVSKRLVEAQDGTISVESQVGKGSIFTMSIPLKKGGA